MSSRRAIRETAPFIGYALSRQAIEPDVHLPSSSDSDTSIADAFDGVDARYDSRIMHHVVPATLELWRVEYDAPDESLARVLNVDLCEIRAHWLTSRSALVDPRPARPVATAKKMPAHLGGGYRRFSRRQHSCAEAAGASMTKPFQAVTLATLQAYRDLASELRLRLENINEEETYEKAMAMKDREATSLESVSCGIEHIPIQKQPSKVDLDVLYGTPL